MLRPNLTIDYNKLESNIKTLNHPVRVKKFTEILAAVRKLLETGYRPTYKKIHEITGCSSRTIANFWKWLRAQGVNLKNIFKTRVEEVGYVIENLKQKGIKPTYRKIREVMKCSFTTISRFSKGFAQIKHTRTISTKPLNYSQAASLFQKLSQVDQERYYRLARDEAGDQPHSIIEKYSITIFAKSKQAAEMAAHQKTNQSSLFKNFKNPTKTVDTQTQKRILDAFNNKLKSKGLIPLKSLGRKDKRLLGKLLDQGYNVEEILQVISTKADEWLKEPKMIPAFRPQTIFKAQKFPFYLNQARAQGKRQPSFKVLKTGTKIEYKGEILTVEEDGIVWIPKNNGRVDEIILPQQLWRLVEAGKVKILNKGKEEVFE